MPNGNMIFDMYDFIRKGEWFVRPLDIWKFEYEGEWLYVVSRNPLAGNIDEREIMNRAQLDARFPTVKSRR